MKKNSKSCSQRIGVRAKLLKNHKVQQLPTSIQDKQNGVTVSKYRPESYFPLFTMVLSLIQVVLFYDLDKIRLSTIFGYDPHRRHEFWRFLTMMVAHNSATHLWMNVISQLILGVLLERIYSWRRISVVYIASGIGSSLCNSVFTPKLYGYGASGAVYGLLLAHLAAIIVNWTVISRRRLRLTSLLVFIAINVWTFVEIEKKNKLETGDLFQISHAGHVAGALTGFLVGILTLKKFDHHTKLEKIVRKICIAILILCFVLIIWVNLAFPSHYLPGEWNFDYEKSFFNQLFETLKNSSEDSLGRKKCAKEVGCQFLLDHYIQYGAIPDYL